MIIYKKILYLTFVITVLQSGCIEIANQYSSLPPGLWRGVLKLDPNIQPLKTNSARLNSDPNTKFETWYMTIPLDFI
jgi:hypothetical protein